MIFVYKSCILAWAEILSIKKINIFNTNHFPPCCLSCLFELWCLRYLPSIVGIDFSVKFSVAHWKWCRWFSVRSLTLRLHKQTDAKSHQGEQIWALHWFSATVFNLWVPYKMQKHVVTKRFTLVQVKFNRIEFSKKEISSVFVWWRWCFAASTVQVFHSSCIENRCSILWWDSSKTYSIVLGLSRWHENSLENHASSVTPPSGWRHKLDVMFSVNRKGVVHTKRTPPCRTPILLLKLMRSLHMWMEPGPATTGLNWGALYI